MSAAKLIGLTAAAAQACADAWGNPAELANRRETLAACFYKLSVEETAALGSAARALLEPKVRHTSDYRAWAEVCNYERLPALWEAAAGFRARLDEAACRRAEYDRRQIAARTEAGIRRAIRPLIAARVSLAEIEEAAGGAAGDAMEWDGIFVIINDEITRAGRRIREPAS